MATSTTQKHRASITITLTTIIDAESPEGAYEALVDGLDRIEGLCDVTVTCVDQREVPYVVPAGAERWATNAKASRFDDNHEHRNDGRRMWGQHDGSWWWTNGHVMLRCDGPPPSDDTVWRRIPDEAFVAAIGLDKERTPAVFYPHKDGTMVPGLVSTFGVSAGYHALVSSHASTWMVGTEVNTPIHCLDIGGRLVAVVMPVRR